MTQSIGISRAQPARYIRLSPYWLSRYWLVLGALPAFFGLGDGKTLMAVAIAGYVLVLYVADLGRGNRYQVADRIGSRLLTLFLLIYALAFLRMPDGILPMTTLVGIIGTCFFICIFFHRYFSKNRVTASAQGFFTFLWSIPIFIFLNVVFSEGGISALLEFVSASRRIFELPGLIGSNSIASMCGVGLIATAVLIRFGSYRFVAAALFALIVVLLLATGARGPALFAFVVTFGVLFASVRVLGAGCKVLVIVSLVSSPLALIVFAALQQSDIADLLVRNGAQNFGVGTGRAQLFEVALAELAQVSPLHLFGYGYGGALLTQALDVLTILFYNEYRSSVNVFLPTLHNLGLQVIFDIGYIGFVVFFFLIWRAATSFAMSSEPVARFGLGILSFTLLSGFTEATGAPYNLEFFFVLLAVLALANSRLNFDPSEKSKAGEKQYLVRRTS